LLAGEPRANSTSNGSTDFRFDIFTRMCSCLD
jgi:hypothetical protein